MKDAWSVVMKVASMDETLVVVKVVVKVDSLVASMASLLAGMKVDERVAL